LQATCGAFDDRRFFLETRQPAIDARRQSLEQRRFLLGREVDQYHDAVAKQHGNTCWADANGQRDRGKRFAFKAVGVDPIADMQGMDSGPFTKLVGRKCGCHPQLPDQIASQ
jgi:hypothetical protein